MSAYYKSTAHRFAETSAAQVVGALSMAQIRRFSGDHAMQLAAWEVQVDLLQGILRVLTEKYEVTKKWGVLFEYPLLRLQRRLDVVILAGCYVVVVEFKIGARTYQMQDIHQVEDYALDLRDFHEASHHMSILPVLCATHAPTRKVTLSHGMGVGPSYLCNRQTLTDLLVALAARESDQQIDIDAWESAKYRPVPSIIKAAELLFSGHHVGDIAYAGSSATNLGAMTDRLIEIVAQAQRNGEHIVAFVTGVPGSGKTLVGLNAVHDPRFRDKARPPGAFLSGNTPLVAVLREALARDNVARTHRTLKMARREVRSQIQGLMAYLEEYLGRSLKEAPIDHVVVFDEAQRAWDAAYGARKFNRPKSEPALLLEIMGRHADWAVVVALVGGGQEINRGEKGLSEWGAAIGAYNRDVGLRQWRAIAAPDVVEGGDATGWQRLFVDKTEADLVERDETLHLGVSVRSYRCLATTRWVDALLDSDCEEASTIVARTNDFPIFLTRSLGAMRDWLHTNARASRRCGLVATSGARRLRAEGLGVTLSASELRAVANWYLLPRGDIRSSYALEVAANEYTCQGLELDYVGVCWDGDLVRSSKPNGWLCRRLSGSKWQEVRKEDMRRWIRNKYRVLLTRARLGTVIWIPRGDQKDETRCPEKLDAVAVIWQERVPLCGTEGRGRRSRRRREMVFLSLGGAWNGGGRRDAERGFGCGGLRRARRRMPCCRYGTRTLGNGS